MTQLQRLVIETKPEELVIRVLYRSKGDSNPNPGTKARTREVTALARSGLTRALEALDAAATPCVRATPCNPTWI